MTARIATWITNRGDVVRVRAARDGYRWTVRAAANGEVVGSGEAHPHFEDAIAAAERHHPQVEAGVGLTDYMKVAEIATTLRVSKMTVYRLLDSGELPAIRVGRSFRITRKAVAEYLRAASTVDGAA